MKRSERMFRHRCYINNFSYAKNNTIFKYPELGSRRMAVSVCMAGAPAHRQERGGHRRRTARRSARRDRPRPRWQQHGCKRSNALSAPETRSTRRETCFRDKKLRFSAGKNGYRPGNLLSASESNMTHRETAFHALKRGFLARILFFCLENGLVCANGECAARSTCRACHTVWRRHRTVRFGATAR